MSMIPCTKCGSWNGMIGVTWHGCNCPTKPTITDERLHEVICQIWDCLGMGLYPAPKEERTKARAKAVAILRSLLEEAGL